MIQHRILKEQGCIFIEVRQSPTLGALKAALQLMTRDPAYRPEFNRLCDLSQANLSHLTIAEVVEIVDFSMQNIPMSASARVAFVVPDEERAGNIRYYTNLIDRSSFRMFKNPLDAKRWLQERPGFRKADGSFCKVLAGVA